MSIYIADNPVAKASEVSPRNRHHGIVDRYCCCAKQVLAIAPPANVG